ncbi:MAG: hypothetical protein HOV80_07080 [Polyangiaceae bacterium]|nr:hypothetical protein [Polyangiaceae bacterium]
MSRFSFRLVGFVSLVVLGACSTVDIRKKPDREGGGGTDSTSAITAQTGTGAGNMGGMGGAGGEACEGGLGTECEPNQKGMLFDGNASAKTVGIDSAGNVVIAGRFSAIDLDGNLLMSAGEQDVFVAKLDGSTGAVMWRRTFGTAEPESRIDLAIDNDDNVVIAGIARAGIDFGGGNVCAEGFGQVYLVKLDTAGEHLFSRCFGDPATSTGGPDPQVATTPSGEIVLFGRSDDDIDLGSGLLPWDEGVLFVATYAPDGQGLWSRKYGESESTPNAYARALAVSPTGHIVVGVSFHESIDFEGLVLESPDDSAALVVELDHDGDIEWGAALRADITLFDLTVGPRGEVVVGGPKVTEVEAAGLSTPVEGTIVALDAQGALRWANGPSGAGAVVVEGVGVDPAGNVLAIARLVHSPQPAGPDLGFSAFSPDGALLFERHFGSGWGFDLALRGAKVAFCGAAGDDPGLDFGGGLLVPGEEYDGGVFTAWFEPWQSAAP